jgi:hypothetical protein
VRPARVDDLGAAAFDHVLEDVGDAALLPHAPVLGRRHRHRGETASLDRVQQEPRCTRTEDRVDAVPLVAKLVGQEEQRRRADASADEETVRPSPREREAASQRPDQVHDRVTAQRREELGPRAPDVEDDLDRRCPTAALVHAVDRERPSQDVRVIRPAPDIHELPGLDDLADLGRDDRQRVIVLAVFLMRQDFPGGYKHQIFAMYSWIGWTRTRSWTIASIA